MPLSPTYQTDNNWLYPALWDGCVGAWCPSLGTQGNSLYDNSGYNNTGTLNSLTLSSAWAIPHVTGLTLDGTGYVDCGNTSFQFTATQPFSMSAWIKTSDSSDHQVICGKYATDGSSLAQGYFMSSLSGNLLLQLQTDGSSYIYRYGNSSIADGNWHFCYAQYDGSGSTSGIRLWVDGVEQSYSGGSSGSLGTLNQTYAFQVGKRVASGSASPLNFTGSVDDLRVYKRLLTVGEHQFLFEGGRGIAYTPAQILGTGPAPIPPVTIETYTSGTSWTVPSAAVYAVVEVWGAGARGGPGSGGPGGGGGSGGYYRKGYTVSSGQTFTYSIGDNLTHDYGTDTTCTSPASDVITGGGGQPGGNWPSGHHGGAGGSYSGSGGYGVAGNAGSDSNIFGTAGGAGGSAPFGGAGGAGGTSGSPAGVAGSVPGGGAGGPYNTDTTQPGGSGQISFTWYTQAPIFGSGGIICGGSGTQHATYKIKGSGGVVCGGSGSTVTLIVAASSVTSVSSSSAIAGVGCNSSVSADSSSVSNSAYAGSSVVTSEASTIAIGHVEFIGIRAVSSVLSESFGTATAKIIVTGQSSVTSASTGTAKPAFGVNSTVTATSSTSAHLALVKRAKSSVRSETFSTATSVKTLQNSSSANSASNSSAKSAYGVHSNVTAASTSTGTPFIKSIGTSSVVAEATGTADCLVFDVFGVSSSVTSASTGTATAVVKKFGHSSVASVATGTAQTAKGLKSSVNSTSTGMATAVIKKFGDSSVSSESTAMATGGIVVDVSSNVASASTGTATAVVRKFGQSSVTSTSTGTAQPAKGFRSFVSSTSSARNFAIAKSFGVSDVTADSTATASGALLFKSDSHVFCASSATATGINRLTGRSSVKAESFSTVQPAKGLRSSVTAESSSTGSVLHPVYGSSHVYAESFSTGVLTSVVSAFPIELEIWLKPQLSCDLFLTLPPKSMELPFCLMSRIDSDIEYYLGKCKTNRTTTISFSIYSTNYPAAMTIRDELATALNGYVGDIGTVYVWDCELTSESDNADPEVLNPGDNASGVIREIQFTIYHSHNPNTIPWEYTDEASLLAQIVALHPNSKFTSSSADDYPLVRLVKTAREPDNYLGRINTFRHDLYKVIVSSLSASQSMRLAEELRLNLGQYTTNEYDSYGFSSDNRPLFKTTLELDCISVPRT